MPLQLMTVEARETKQDGTDGAKCGKVVRETIHVLDSALLVHCAGSPPFPLPDDHLDVLGNLVQLFPPSLSSTTILKPAS